MATRSTATKSSRKTGSSQTSSSGRRSRKSANRNQGSLLLAIWAGLTGLYGGRVFLALTVASLVIWIEALLFKQNCLSYFRLVGIEILLVLLVGWFFYMVQSNQAE